MKPPFVSIVTVTYNSYRCLQRLRESLLSYTTEPWEWIIVDNGSPRPETKRLLRELEQDPGFVGRGQVIYLDENLWFTKGSNVGLASAKGELLLLLNPDCAVTPGWLDALRAAAARPKVGIVGTVLVNERRQVVHGGARGMGDHDGDGMYYKPDDPWCQDREHDGWVTGACLMISRQALDAVGGKLDEAYPHYSGDIALAVAIRQAGYKVWMASHPIVHSVGGSGL